MVLSTQVPYYTHSPLFQENFLIPSHNHLILKKINQCLMSALSVVNRRVCFGRMLLLQVKLLVVLKLPYLLILDSNFFRKTKTVIDFKSHEVKFPCASPLICIVTTEIPTRLTPNPFSDGNNLTPKTVTKNWHN